MGRVYILTLIALDGLQPPFAHDGTVNHDIDLHAMAPTLRVHVPVSLDPQMAVHDHELDMAAPFLELVVDGLDLVFRNVVVDV